MAALLDRFSLAGRVALVTGASSGIGRRMATALIQAGADVVLVARRQDAIADAAAALTAEGPGQAAAVAWDVAALDTLPDLARAAAEPFGPLSILVNAAGINPRKPWQELTPEIFRQTNVINLEAPFFLAQALVPAMIDGGWGRIINIASLQSFRAFAHGMPYGASKGGIAQVTRAMAEAWSRHGIMANAIAPGFFETELTAKVFEDKALVDHHASATAVGRNGRLEDFDGLTVFLASDACDYVTGQVIALDGGYLAK